MIVGADYVRRCWHRSDWLDFAQHSVAVVIKLKSSESIALQLLLWLLSTECQWLLSCIIINLFDFECIRSSPTWMGLALTIDEQLSALLMNRSPNKFNSFIDFLAGLHFPLGAASIKLCRASFVRLNPWKLFHKTTAMRLYKIWLPRKRKHPSVKQLMDGYCFGWNFFILRAKRRPQDQTFKQQKSELSNLLCVYMPQIVDNQLSVRQNLIYYYDAGKMRWDLPTSRAAAECTVHRSSRYPIFLNWIVCDALCISLQISHYCTHWWWCGWI